VNGGGRVGAAPEAKSMLRCEGLAHSQTSHKYMTQFVSLILTHIHKLVLRSHSKQKMPPKRSHPLAARIKRMMQADEDVGKIAQLTPLLMGTRGMEAIHRRAARTHTRPCTLARAHTRAHTRPARSIHPPPTPHPPQKTEHAMELFLQQLCERSAALARERGAKAVTPSHLCVFVCSGFLVCSRFRAQPAKNCPIYTNTPTPP
jgi:hypothetical protein